MNEGSLFEVLEITLNLNRPSDTKPLSLNLLLRVTASLIGFSIILYSLQI